MRPFLNALAFAIFVAAAWDRPVLAQNDWQFPDPYFGAVEFDVSRQSAARQQRVERAPPPALAPRTRAMRSPRSFRQRTRWTPSGARP